MLRWAAVTAVVLGAPCVLRAQSPADIAVRVTDAFSGAPLADAEVVIAGGRGVTGADGRATVAMLTAGRVGVQVRRIGYAPWRELVDLSTLQARALAVALRPVSLRLDSIVATAAGGLLISGEELVGRGTDLARALDGWEGIVVRRTASGGPSAPQIRGGSPDELLVLVDGVALNDPLTGRADLSRVPTRQVARVKLLPGAQTAIGGGRAIAGLLLVTTAASIRPELVAWRASHGAMGGQAGAAAGRFSALVSGERYAENYAYRIPAARGTGDAPRLNAGGEAWSTSLRWRAPIDLGFRGWVSRRGLPGTVTNPSPIATARDGSAVLTARGGGSLAWQASATFVEARAADPAPPAGVAYDSYSRGLSAGLDFSREAPVSLGGWRGPVTFGVAARADRFSGDAVAERAAFAQAGLRASAVLSQGKGSAWTLSPALRLDRWTGHASPAVSARLDVAWQRGATSVNAAVGSAVAPPVLADLFFREGVGVRLNPDLRPERVRWEGEAGVSHKVGIERPASFGLRLFYGRVGDMVVWAPDFRFIWSPRNFDVLRRGGELTLDWRPWAAVRFDGSATLAAVTYDVPGGAQVLYRPRTTGAAGIAWSPGGWRFDLRTRFVGARFPNSAGTNPRPAITTTDLGAERSIANGALLRAEIRDLGDERPEFIAGYPTPGRSLYLTFTLRKP